MKRFMMKLFSILLVSCLVLNSSISFSTACSIPDSSVDLTAYNQESVELLRKYNYTDEEIALLLEYDRTHPVSPPMSECSLYAVDLPQNPKEGDVVYYDTVFTFEEITGFGTDAASIAIAIAVKSKVTAAVAAVVARRIADYLNSHAPFKSVIITVKWYYGMTNDLVLGWTSVIHDYKIKT